MAWKTQAQNLEKILKETFRYDFTGQQEPIQNLLKCGMIRDAKGHHIKPGRTEEESRRLIGNLLDSRTPFYVYGESDAAPREVRGEQNGLIKVGKHLNEVENPEAPKKPNIFWRYINFIAGIFGGTGPFCKEWNEYNRQMDASKKLLDSDTVKDHQNEAAIYRKQTAALRQKFMQQKAAEAEASAKKQPEKAEPQIEAKSAAPEEPAKAQDPAIQELLAQMKAMNEKIASLESQLAGKKAEEPAPVKETEEMKSAAAQVDAALADWTQKESIRQDLEARFKEFQDAKAAHQAQIASDEQLAWELQKEEYEAAAKSGKTAEQIKTDAQLAKKLQGEELKQTTQSAEKKTAPQEPVNAESGHQPKNRGEELLGILQKQNGGQPLPEVLTKNVLKMYSEAENAKKVLQEKCQNGGLFSGGEAVKAIVAFHDMEQCIRSNSTSMIEHMKDEKYPEMIRSTMNLCPQMVYASKNSHQKGYFEKNFLTDEGVERMWEHYQDSLVHMADQKMTEAEGLEHAKKMSAQMAARHEEKMKSKSAVGKDKEVPPQHQNPVKEEISMKS